MNVPAIKVYKMDYSFLVKNYIDQKLWGKVWTLFEYKSFVITLEMTSINVCSRILNFVITLKDNSNPNLDNSCSKFADHYVEKSDISFLIRKINNRIVSLITEYEREKVIPEMPECKELRKMRNEEEKKLEIQAINQFYGNERISGWVLESFISNYVLDNSTYTPLIGELLDSNVYHHLTDLYLVFLKSVNRIDDYDNIIGELTEDEKLQALQEIAKYETYQELVDFQM